jgi:hypothetical protein
MSHYTDSVTCGKDRGGKHETYGRKAVQPLRGNVTLGGNLTDSRGVPEESGDSRITPICPLLPVSPHAMRARAVAASGHF